MKTPKSQLTAEQPLTKKLLEPTKNDTLHPKTKKKPQWDSRSGTITTKSNPIHAGWLTHKLENNYTTEVLTQEWKSWAPCQTSQPGGLARGRSPQRIQLWRPVQFDHKNSTGLGQTETPLLEGAHRSCVHQDQGKRQLPHKRLGQTYLLVLEGLLQRRGEAVAHCRDKDTGSCSSGEYSLMWYLLEAAIFSPRPSPTQQHVGSTAGMPWVKQPTGWEHSPTYQQTDCLKSSWALPCPPEGQDPAQPTSGQEPVPPTRKPSQTS